MSEQTWLYTADYTEEGIMLMMVSEEFFDANGHLDDTHIADEIGDRLPEGFDEIAEGMFVYEGSLEDCHAALAAAGGFKQDERLLSIGEEPSFD